LSSVIKSGLKSGLVVERRRHGIKEDFKSAGDGVSKVQPRYYLIGSCDVTSPGIQDQLNLCKAIQGTKVTDETASSRRKAAWKLWADNSLDEKAREYEKHDMPSIMEAFSDLLLLVSMASYDESLLDKFLTDEQKNAVKVHVINNKGVKGKDKARAVAKNEKAKEKALRRKKADKTIQDFEREAQAETVDNDNGWVDYDDQVIIQRRKELSTAAFWKEQTLEVLLERYKYIFPGINDAPLGKKGVPTKTNILKLISAYIKADPSRIDLQHAVGLDSKSDTGATKRKKAVAAFFKNSGSTDVCQHYFEFSSLKA
jgi:hypothetical protein